VVVVHVVADSEVVDLVEVDLEVEDSEAVEQLLDLEVESVVLPLEGRDQLE
jgi:hypothetical protein